MGGSGRSKLARHRPATVTELHRQVVDLGWRLVEAERKRASMAQDVATSAMAASEDSWVAAASETAAVSSSAPTLPATTTARFQRGKTTRRPCSEYWRVEVRITVHGISS